MTFESKWLIRTTHTKVDSSHAADISKLSSHRLWLDFHFHLDDFSAVHTKKMRNLRSINIPSWSNKQSELFLCTLYWICWLADDQEMMSKSSKYFFYSLMIFWLFTPLDRERCSHITTTTIKKQFGDFFCIHENKKVRNEEVKSTAAQRRSERIFSLWNLLISLPHFHFHTYDS